MDSVMGYGGTRSKHSKAEASNYKDRRAAFVPLKPLPQSEKGFDHRSVPKSNVKAKLHSLAKDLDFSDAESSSSGSSSDEFINVNPRLPPKSPTSRIPRPNCGPTKPFHMIEKLDISSEALYRFEESLYDSPVSTSRFSDVTHESLALSLSPLQYPPVQFMARQGAFDPYRIPESVFERPSTPTEWSANSNDSLFSIRIGNSSFSKNHVSTTNVDLFRSSEQPKSEEFRGYEKTSTHQSEKHCEPGETYRSGESRTGDLKRPDHLIKTAAMVQSIEVVKSNVNMDVAKTWNEDSNTGAVNQIKYNPTAIMNNQIEEVVKDSRNYLCGNRIVDKRESAMQSSVITKKKKSSCPLCYSPNCSHICHFKWPSCSCKFPSCSCKSCLSCPSCCCKTCLGCPSCSCTSCLSCPSCSCRSCLSCPSCSCMSCLSCPSCSCMSCLSCPSCSCRSCLTCPSCSCRSCFKWPSCSCKSCLHWPSCCCKSLRCPSCTCKCFKWTNCCSWKCFRRPKCSSKCLHCQSCSCKWLTCTGCCTCNLFCCECFKWPSCKFSCPSPLSCCSKCCTCSCSKSNRRWFCFSCSCCNPCSSCNSC